MGKEKIIEAIKNGNLGGMYDESIGHINEDTSVRELLLEKFTNDMEQYLDNSFGDDKPTVVVEEDKSAYVVWRNWKMPPIRFYAAVFNNGGKMTPSAFQEYGQEKTAKE